ncbi:MAG TPA: hypothetical protein DCF63_18540 [Planctomycetaceae bacterium]|nr:hypothetical protein [Planctomycetaceae bacterium]
MPCIAIKHFVVDLARDPLSIVECGNSGEFHYVSKLVGFSARNSSQRCVIGSYVTATRRSAISLLEVVLALAILAVATAYLSQATHLATENAGRARTISHAEIIAESVVNQIIAGVLPAQSASWTNYTSPNAMNRLSAGSPSDSQWMYQVQISGTEVSGMINLQVGVIQARLGRELGNQADLYVQRWMIDPQLGLDKPIDLSTMGSTGGL